MVLQLHLIATMLLAACSAFVTVPLQRSSSLEFYRAAHRRRAIRASASSSECGLSEKTPLQELQAKHYGALRTVWQMDTNEWLDGTITLNALPEYYNIITSLPDIAEIRSRARRVTPTEYEDWFVGAVAKIMHCLSPRQVTLCLFLSGTGETAPFHACHRRLSLYVRLPVYLPAGMYVYR